MGQHLSLKDVATALEKNYDTLRHYASVRYRDTFPKPAVTSSGGKGLLWDVEDVREWYVQHEEYVLTSVDRHNGVDDSKRAKLGHKFRKVRMRNQCSECSDPFYRGEEIWEVRRDDDLYLMHEGCYDRFIDSENRVSSPGTGDS